MADKSRNTAFIMGASSGIGEALAIEFASRGYNVVLCARRRERLESLKKQVEQIGSQALAIACDIRNSEDISAAFATAINRFHKIDIVVANAGISRVGEVETFTTSGLREIFETNVFGIYETVQKSLPYLRQSKGSIVIMGSVMTYLSGPNASAYCMSKAALKPLSESLRYELIGSGVSVTFVCPGYISTEIRRLDEHGQFSEHINDPVPPWLAMKAAKAARIMARDIQARKPVSVVTFHGKFAIWLERHFPQFLRLLLTMASARLQKVMKKREIAQSSRAQ